MTSETNLGDLAACSYEGCPNKLILKPIIIIIRANERVEYFDSDRCFDITRGRKTG